MVRATIEYPEPPGLDRGVLFVGRGGECGEARRYSALVTQQGEAGG